MSTPYEYTFTIWDWNVTWRDFDLFRRTLDQLPDLGFTTVELGVPWMITEARPGELDFSGTDQRLAEVSQRGLDVRFRVNVQDFPQWLTPDVFRFPDQTPMDKVYGSQPFIPSMFDDDALAAQTAWVRSVGEHFGGHNAEYTLGIGLHFELKYGGWCTYEPVARDRYRGWLQSRYGSIAELNAGWGTAHRSFAEVEPPVPGIDEAFQSGRPDLSPASCEWIRFREERLNEVVATYLTTLRAADPTAEMSIPLGEAFRSQSAEFANQDVYGLSRHADNIVCSYDFFIHSPHEMFKVRQIVQAYGGISGRPVKVELDGVETGTYRRYGDEPMYDFAVAAIRGGARGINLANYTQERRWPEDLSQFPFMGRLGEALAGFRSGDPLPLEPASPSRGLAYLSKWTTYTRRAADEGVHAAQFGMLQALADRGVTPRIITDENLLAEDLSGAEYLLLPYAEVLDPPVAQALARLARSVPLIQDQQAARYLVPVPGQVEPPTLPFGLDDGQEAKMSCLTTGDGRDPEPIPGDFSAPPAKSGRVPATAYSPVNARPSWDSDAGPMGWVSDSVPTHGTLGFSLPRGYNDAAPPPAVTDAVLSLIQRCAASRRPAHE